MSEITEDPIRYWESGDLSVSKGVLGEGQMSVEIQARLGARVEVQIDKGWATNGSDELGDLLSDVSTSRLFHGSSVGEEVRLNLRIGFAETEMDRAFETLVKSMFLGERSQATVRAFVSSRVKSNSEPSKKMLISFEGVVSLVNVTDSCQVSKVPIASKLLLIDDLKTLGSAIFAEKRYWDAFYLFRQALSLALFAKSEADDVKATSTDFDPSVIEDLRLKCAANLVACHFQLDNFDHTISLASSILPDCHSPLRVKLLYRKGVAYIHRNEFDLAVTDLREASSLDPLNKAIQINLQKAVANQKANEKKLQNALKKMFSQSQN